VRCVLLLVALQVSNAVAPFRLGMIATALRAGSPLPQITPCPLLDRFVERSQGLDVIHKESEEDYGLPRTLTLDTLQNEQYL
jgi:hypothetical protein